jgi:hypothetical protein
MSLREALCATRDRSRRRFLGRERVIHRAVAAVERWPGVRAGRRVVEFLDGRSESGGESVSRLWLMEEGLPAPEPQFEIFGTDGRFVARVDFYWKDQKTVGEFDGKLKYSQLLKLGQRIEDVIFEEKLREDALRDLGLQVVRWIWDDLYRPAILRERVLRAFARIPMTTYSEFTPARCLRARRFDKACPDPRT